MMEAIEKLLLDKGCPKINLQIRSINTDVVKFYISMGYITDDVISLGKRLIKD